MAKKTVLLVEDEEDILGLLTYHLEQEGFDILSTKDGAQALEISEEQVPDLIILDIMLPGLVGTEVCKVLKQREETRHIPIIMLTAKGEEIDRVVGFELGADDYVTKPFSPRELILRIKAILKRIHVQAETSDIIHLQGMRIDVPKHQVLVDKKPVELTATEFKLLLTLAERKGRVQTRDMLLESVWGYDYMGFTRTVDTHVRRLRSKLGPCGECIETVRGVGYRISERTS